MKVLFILSCILLYLVLGRLYIELIFLPQLGDPKDYNDLYRGLKTIFRIMGNNALDDKWWIDSEKEFGNKWAIVWVEFAEFIWSVMFVVFLWQDMKQSLIQLLHYLK